MGARLAAPDGRAGGSVPRPPRQLDAWASRSYRESDIPLLAQVWNESLAADGLGELKATEEEIKEALARPGVDPFRDVVVAEEAGAHGSDLGRPAGFAFARQVDDPEADERIYYLNIQTRPAARDRGVASFLIERVAALVSRREAGERAPARTNVVLKCYPERHEQDTTAALRRAGFAEYRRGWTMACPLSNLDEPSPVKGVTIRTYVYPDDNERALEAFNASFADMFDFHPNTREQWDYRIGRTQVRPDLSWLAEVEDGPDRGRLVGFCICLIGESENRATGRNDGWIALLGTVRGWRNRGLGTSLLLTGMRSLKQAGMDTALLGVDSESLTGAQRLYENVGFQVRYLWVNHQARLDDLVTPPEAPPTFTKE
jgi:mycothiol synthase